jgi:DNA (cytosine-5)-methyltransferase 1
VSPTIATLCAGGGGIELGARAAGLVPIYGIEIDQRIAEVARANGISVTVGDVRTLRPSDFPGMDVLHASPPCPNFSQANTGGKESAEDVSIAAGVARWITHHLPRWFTLENVGRYHKSQSWRTIEAALEGGGYIVEVYGDGKRPRLCAADTGVVPQTRRRMWVRAVRGGLLPPLPPAQPWRGWYDAVEDLLPSCPESLLANWQRERLKDHPVVGPLLVGAGGFRGTVVNREAGESAMSITADRNQCDQVRAVLVASGNSSRAPTVRRADEPAQTVVAQSDRVPTRAVLVSSNSIDGGAPALRDGQEPALTVDTKTPAHVRAVLVGDQSAAAGKGVITRTGDEPAMTVRAGDTGGNHASVLLLTAAQYR